MKLMPRSRERRTISAASASVFPAVIPRRLCPPHPSPITLTVRPVRPNVVKSIRLSPFALSLSPFPFSLFPFALMRRHLPDAIYRGEPEPEGGGQGAADADKQGR